MKSKLLFLGSLMCLCFSAQQGNVGINTSTPSAALDIVSKGNTSATKALKVSNFSATEIVTVRDNGQVGINQDTPATDALLELNSTNKSLLLTRVNNATDVATPVNGMMVYDITQKCVRGYENNAWSGCLSGGGGPQPFTPVFPWETDLRFKQYSIVGPAGSNMYVSGGTTTDGKVFLWGRDYYGFITGNNLITSDSKWKSSPVFMDGTGKWGNGNAVKLQFGNEGYYVLDSSGNVWVWGNQESGQLGDGVKGLNPTAGRRFSNATKMILPTGVAKFIDISTNYAAVFLLGDNGKLYYYGYDNKGVSHIIASIIPFPTGVSANFKYTKFWKGNESGRNDLFMVGNDGYLYSTVINTSIAGNPTAAGGTGTWGVTINKVDLPASEVAKIKKIDTDSKVVFALTTEGKIYAWGEVGGAIGADYTYECKFPDTSGITVSGSSRYAYSPKLISLPSGETSYIDVTAMNPAYGVNLFLCASGKAYTIGVDGSAFGSGSVDQGGTLGNYGTNRIYSDYTPTYALYYVPNLTQINSPGAATLALDKDGKLWGFGVIFYCMNGGGHKCLPTESTALPLMNGNLDPNNPRPQTVN